MVADVLTMAPTVGYILYMNSKANGIFYCPAEVDIQSNESYKQYLLSKINAIEHEHYRFSACITTPLSVISQSTLNEYNISANITQLDKLAASRAFWDRSLLYIIMLIPESLFMIMLIILYFSHIENGTP